MKKTLKPNAEGKYEGHIIRFWVTKQGEDRGKSYVVHTTNLADRIRLWNQPGSKIGGKKIMEAREKYTPNEDWQYEYIEKVTKNTAKELMEELKMRHTFYIDKFDSVNNGYNTCRGGTGNRGVKFSDEWKEKISKNHRDYQTEEARRKISQSNLGRPVSEATRAKISVTNTGKKRTEEQRKAQSERMKGADMTKINEGAARWRANNESWWKTHPFSEEAKANRKAAQQARGRKIKATSETGEVWVFPTMLDAAKQLGIGAGSIHNVLKTGNILKSCGYRFEEISEQEYNRLLPFNPTIE